MDCVLSVDEVYSRHLSHAETLRGVIIVSAPEEDAHQTSEEADRFSSARGALGYQHPGRSFRGVHSKAKAGIRITARLEPLAVRGGPINSLTDRKSSSFMDLPSWAQLIPAPAQGTFKVMTWNILAETYCSPSKYPNVYPQHLDGKYRAKLIRRLLPEALIDLAVQEVGMRVWREHLWPELEKSGYASVNKYNESGEGVAIIWKKEVFTLVKEKTFLFNPVAREYCGKLDQEKQLYLKGLCSTVRFIQSHNCVAFVLIKHAASGKEIAVVSTHPPRNNITYTQVLQGWLITQGTELKLFAPARPVIWCGDFNTLPNSPLYQFLHKRTVTIEDDPTAHRPPPVLTHDLQLLSAFSLQREPITHHTKQFRGTIDYVFVSPDSLQVCGLQQPDEGAAKQGIPSETEPSDHLPLLVQLMCVGVTPHTGL